MINVHHSTFDMNHQVINPKESRHVYKPKHLFNVQVPIKEYHTFHLLRSKYNPTLHSVVHDDYS